VRSGPVSDECVVRNDGFGSIASVRHNTRMLPHCLTKQTCAGSTPRPLECQERSSDRADLQPAWPLHFSTADKGSRFPSSFAFDFEQAAPRNVRHPSVPSECQRRREAERAGCRSPRAWPVYRVARRFRTVDTARGAPGPLLVNSTVPSAINGGCEKNGPRIAMNI
jgi:hypothetical protein